MTPRLTVWAPTAARVEALLDGDPRPMHPTADGWWALDADVRPGDRYAFSVDGGDPRPDPRSLSQPDGVHAASEVVDLGAHDWRDAGWRGAGDLRRQVIYELHVGTFTPAGTLDAAIAHLDHLADLGVTLVELMPVAAFPGRHGWGYDGVGLYTVHAPYGGHPALQRFVDASHARGLGVGLDVVYNHLGPSGNYLAEFGPYFTDRHSTPWGDAVNLDGPHSDGVRAFVLDNARMWLEDLHLDALRLDAVHALRDDRALVLLEELAALADDLSESTGAPRRLIAESDRNDPATVTERGPAGRGGLGLHLQWADDVHHGLHVALTGESGGYYADFAAPDALARVLTRTPFFHDGTWSSFRGRVHGRAVDLETTPPARFVASLQTHDQVGNRATGDRLSHQAGPDRAAAGAALLLTAPWTPMLFMGEEWAAGTPWQYFTDHQEPDLAEAIRQGRFAEFAAHGWGEVVPDPQDPGTVAASTLDWTEPGRGRHARMLHWYRTLLRLRARLVVTDDTPAASLAQATLERDDDLVVVRRPAVVVVANLGESGRVTDLGPGSELLAAWGEPALEVQDRLARLSLPGGATAVLAPG